MRRSLDHSRCRSRSWRCNPQESADPPAHSASRRRGPRSDGAGLDAETQNGPADLRIPEGYNAKIDFGTVNGPMSVAFPLTVTINGRITDRISTTLGSGGAPIRVVTTNGPMTVR